MPFGSQRFSPKTIASYDCRNVNGPLEERVCNKNVVGLIENETYADDCNYVLEMSKCHKYTRVV